MIAKREIWKYPQNARVWAGKYRNSRNLLHWHYDCEFICVEKGSLDVFCDKKNHTLSAGEALFTDSGQIHYQSAREPDTILAVIVFDYSIVRPFLEKYQLVSPKLSGSYNFFDWYARLLSILRERKPFFGEEAQCAVWEMMIEVFRGERLVHRTESNRTDENFKKLLEDIQEKYADYKFEQAVRFMGMSDAYFSRYFKAVTGTTFSQYLNYVRTDNAVKLLRSGKNLPMTEIAERCGFATIRSFNRSFREFTGFSPSRLPENFVLSGQYAWPVEKAIEPTLYGCELIESCDSV